MNGICFQFISLEDQCISQYLSLSHSYHSVIFLINYMTFYKKKTDLQSYNRVN